MTPRFCTRCGAAATAGATSCEVCRHSFVVAADEPTATLSTRVTGERPRTSPAQPSDSAEVANHATLVITAATRGTTRVFELAKDVTHVGRAATADLRLDDVSVSRRHAQIVRDPSGHYTFVDEASLNGTYLNGVRADDGRLRHGDQLQIGRFKLVFQAPATA